MQPTATTPEYLTLPLDYLQKPSFPCTQLRKNGIPRDDKGLSFHIMQSLCLKVLRRMFSLALNTNNFCKAELLGSLKCKQFFNSCSKRMEFHSLLDVVKTQNRTGGIQLKFNTNVNIDSNSSFHNKIVSIQYFRNSSPTFVGNIAQSNM